MLVIRTARPDEYDRYAPVMIQLTKEHVAAIFFLPEDAPKKHWFDKSFEPDHLILFAEDDDKLVGILKAHVQMEGDSPHTVMLKRKTLYVADMVVDQSARGKGVGRKLFEAALKWGKEQGAVDSTLSVYAFNQGAIAFYESLGYKVMSQEMRLPF
jgi:diamine N-acetyltransferase